MQWLTALLQTCLHFLSSLCIPHKIKESRIEKLEDTVACLARVPHTFMVFFFFFEFGYRLFIKLWSIESDLVHWIKLWCKNRCSKNVRNKWKRLCFRTINNIICKYRSWRVFILPFFNSYIFKLLFLANRTIQIIRFQKY